MIPATLLELVLLVCSAIQAARETDTQFLNALRAWFDARLERRQPPILAIVTPIDQLVGRVSAA